MKQDQRRISKQEWEIDYLRKIAKEAIKSKVFFSMAKTKRLAKAVLKFTNKR